MHWRTVWSWLRTWQGAVPATIAVLAAIYYGPRRMLETWDWYCERWWDNEVYFVISRRKIIPPAGGAVQSNRNWPPVVRPTELAYTTKEIADYLGRKESSVVRSLKRLRRRGKIEPYQDGWRIKGS